jgi:hypothetical protein
MGDEAGRFQPTRDASSSRSRANARAGPDPVNAPNPRYGFENQERWTLDGVLP